MKDKNTIGVILLNLGGPERLEDVEPFLFNLFSDRALIRLGPAFLQKPLARLIARKRAPKSKKNYQQIGGGSPLLTITSQQAHELERLLAQDGSYLVRPCMRYWHPFAHEVLPEILQKNIQKLIALPLYPHYSIATSGSSFADLKAATSRLDSTVHIKTIPSWPTEPDYIASLVEKIEETVSQFDGEPVQIVYSAHSLPVRFIEEGDPYVKELQQTIKALEKKTHRQGVLCYQSRSGPVKWLEPSLQEMLEKLANQRCKNLVVVPISFVSDHVETLYELEIEYREVAEHLGMRYKVTGGLNSSPKFIEGLRKLVLRASEIAAYEY
ncbi:MAG: ferrochelatase [Desulfobulbus propionicus]|nr:MAG: ferrochelatase [Desulfobulbus propionicus]